MILKRVAVYVQLVIVFTISAAAQCETSSDVIDINAMLQDHGETIPFPEVQLTFTAGPNAPEKGIECESIVDSSSGKAQCFINTKECNADSRIRVNYTITLSDEEFYTPDPSRYVKVVVRGCSFVIPPKMHRIVYKHNSYNRYEIQLAYLDGLLGDQRNSDIRPVLTTLASDTKQSIISNSPELVDSIFAQATASMDASILSLRLAKRYPEGSQYRKRFLERSTNYQKVSVQLANTVIKYKLQSYIETDINDELNIQTGAKLAEGYRLTDYYNNLLVLQSNRHVIEVKLSEKLTNEETPKATKLLDSITSARQLDSKSIRNLEQITELIQFAN